MLSIFIGAALFGQSSIEKKFEKFLKSSTQNNGTFQFETMCFVDSSYYLDEETGDFSLILSNLNRNFSKSDNFQIERNQRFITASFTSAVYSEVGKVIGKKLYRIEFIKNRKTFEILSVTVDNRYQWKKIDGCWKTFLGQITID